MKEISDMRKLLLGIAMLVSSIASAQETYPEVFKMDTHSHVDVAMERDSMPGKKVDLRTAMKKAGMDAIGMTFAVDYVTLKYKGHAWERFLNALAEQDTILMDNNIARALNADDAINAWKQHEPVVIQCVEGGHFLEGDVSRLDSAYNRGLRVFCLLHDNDTNPPLGDVYTNEPKFGGLTQLGADAIHECERLGILVDLAHCDSATVVGVLKVATKPVIITHTGLNTRLGTNEFMGKMMYKRLISPAVARLVASKGGVIGIWPHLANTAKEYADNIKAMVDIVGVDHVCIGTDTKITPEVQEIDPVKIAQFQKEHKDDGKGFGGKGKDKNDHKGGPQGFPEKNPNAANHVFASEPDNFYHSVIRCLLDDGFSMDDVKKICGGNFLRVFGIATNK